jgi:EmrB/QacA subfamily drug resistance transporter
VTEGAAQKKSWLPLVILGAAQFVMVLDSSVMNVSISQIVADLHTTIQGVQGAITAYTLVMAAFMLVGAKLGDIYGRDRIFAIGLGVYGVGSLTTALSPNLSVLLFGWSLVEGLGAVMVIPAIAALIAANYEGKQRALAYGVIGGVAGAAIAAGPLIGGWVTTEFSWRWVFAAETVVVVGILLFRKLMAPAPRADHRPKLDVVGAALSAIGLALVVFAVLKSSSWGWIAPKSPPTIGGREIDPFGLSVVPFLIAIGIGFLMAFSWWEERRQGRGEDALLDRALLKIEPLKAGLMTLGTMQLVLLGTFFVLPVYLQVVQGLDAFETGKRLFPMSISMLIAALAGPKMAARNSPRHVCQIGLVAMAGAALLLMGTIHVTPSGAGFSISLILFGIGAGLLMSQLGNVIMTSAPPQSSNEAGGLQGTAQNLGASLGTALIGAILLTTLTNSFVTKIQQNPDLPQRVKTSITDSAAKGIDVVSVDQVRQGAKDAGLTSDNADAVAKDYGDAQIDGLKVAMLGVAILAALGLWFTRRLPAKPLGPPV